VGFAISQKALERLEWPQVLARLAALARTPRARARLRPGEGAAEAGAPSLFEPEAAGARARLAETSEARRILGAGDLPPLGGVVEPGESLARARKGGALAPRELLDLRGTLGALRATARFLRLRREAAPGLAEIAAGIADLAGLEEAIGAALEPGGEVRDAASPALAEARREVRRLDAELERGLERILRDPAVRARLSDQYFTLRGGRSVLPVRADARGELRGIVHDASSSGATLYVEPEALVELNNVRKQADMQIARETERVLRELSGQAAAQASAIAAGLAALAEIDLAFARAALAQELAASEPELGEAGILRLPQLRHPLLPPAQAVPSDLALGEGFSVLVLSGPNAGGKTVTLKAIALAALFARAGLHVAAGPGARVDLFDSVHADIGDEQDLRASLSTFSAHMATLAATLREAGARSLVVLDEIGVGTDPGEGAALAQAALEALADAGARVVTTTHLNLLKEMAEVDPRFENACLAFDDETLAPTYRVHLGHPGSSSASAVAARMGIPTRVVERAAELLDREDRRLDRLLAELSASRAQLEREQREATRVRAEGEAVRGEYRARLEALQARREVLFRAMRDDLDRGFRDAHARIADVIRDLQRGGSARDAAEARERLQEIEARAQRAAREAGLAGAEERLEPVDWQRARVGDPVALGGGRSAALLALPDQRGRVAVRVGGLRVLLPVERVGALAPGAAGARPRAPAVKAPVSGEDVVGGAERCDLRGLRVDEALGQLDRALDRAAAAGCRELFVVHGLGTGALRQAVRRALAESPYAARFRAGAQEEGGEGVTRVELAGGGGCGDVG